MKKIKQEYLISAPIEKVWQALVDPKIINEWGAGPAKMSSDLGSFSLWGGDIHGTNTKIIKNKLLEQDWFGGDWEEPSKLKFILSQEKGKTKIELIQENIPDKEVDDIDDGWKQYYLGPLKELVES